MQQRADPNSRRRGNLRSLNEALLARLRRQGVQARLSHAPDGTLGGHASLCGLRELHIGDQAGSA
jgi:hypothetical protein